MQWTREGAYNVLQISTMITSTEWEHNWQQTIFSTLKAVA